MINCFQTFALNLNLRHYTQALLGEGTAWQRLVVRPFFTQRAPGGAVQLDLALTPDTPRTDPACFQRLLSTLAFNACFQRLKLNYDRPLASFAFNFNMCPFKSGTPRCSPTVCTGWDSPWHNCRLAPRASCAAGCTTARWGGAGSPRVLAELQLTPRLLSGTFSS
jgi:hypothetical protein